MGGGADKERLRQQPVRRPRHAQSSTDIGLVELVIRATDPIHAADQAMGQLETDGYDVVQVRVPYPLTACLYRVRAWVLAVPAPGVAAQSQSESRTKAA